MSTKSKELPCYYCGGEGETYHNNGDIHGDSTTAHPCPECSPEEMDDLDLLVRVLKDALMLLVREGYITEVQANERARQQAMGFGAYFELKRAQRGDIPCPNCPSYKRNLICTDCGAVVVVGHIR